MNLPHSLIGPIDRAPNIGPHRGHAQHAPAVCHDGAIPFSRARVEDHHVVHLPGRLQSRDPLPLFIRTRIPPRSHHHTHRRVVGLFQLHFPETAFRHGHHQRHQIGLQQRQHHLRFRISEPAIEFHHLQFLIFDHQPCVKHPLIQPALFRHPIHRRTQHLLHHPLQNRLRHDRRRGIRSHPARIRSAIPVENGFVILRRHQRQNGLPVRQRKNRSLLSLQKLLHHDFLSRGSEGLILHDRSHRLKGLGLGPADQHAFARSQPIRLHHNRRALLPHITHGFLTGGKPSIARRRNPVLRHQILRESLAALKLGRLPGWPENLQSPLLEPIHDPQRQRHLRPHHRQINPLPNGKRQQLIRIIRPNIHTLRQLRHPGISRRRIEPTHLRALSDLPHQRMLATAAANN